MTQLKRSLTHFYGSLLSDGQASETLMLCLCVTCVIHIKLQANGQIHKVHERSK